MSGVSIMGRQVGGACRAGRMIGLSHSGTRLVLPNPADNLIVNGGFEQVLTGWTTIGDGSVVTSSSANSAVHDPHGGLAWYMSRSNDGGVSDRGRQPRLTLPPRLLACRRRWKLMAQSHGDGHGRRRGGGINQNANQG